MSVVLATGCGAPVFSAADGGYDLNDVSFLMPLPGAAERDALLAMASAGDQGALLPKVYFDQLPELLQGVSKDLVYSQLRVVSVRVDPCFPGATPPAAPLCRKQVRLVAQPVVLEADAGTASVTTEDATVHLFYDLDDAQFQTVLDGLQALKAQAGDATRGQPLDVHPVMKAQGVRGEYAKALNALVLKAAGESTLTRVAFMTLINVNNRWAFGAFNRSGATLVADEIPRTKGKLLQGVVEQGSGGTSRAGELVPTIAGDELPTLLESLELASADEGTLKRALTSALQIEHPERSSPRTIDCASCHVASRARTNAERVRKVTTTGWADAFNDARFDLRRVDEAKEDPRALRAFGYFGKLSALSQRTINESAAIAAALSK